MSHKEITLLDWLKHAGFAAVFFTLVIIASLADILSDVQQGSNTTHILQELLIVVVAGALLARLLVEERRHLRINQELTRTVTQLEIQASATLTEAKQSLAREIDQQFLEWQLTESERSVAWLLLKGYNSKEIAALRDSSDKTVRNQLSTVYKKSGLRDKHVFIAWFLDDLLGN